MRHSRDPELPEQFPQRRDREWLSAHARKHERAAATERPRLLEGLQRTPAQRDPVLARRLRAWGRDGPRTLVRRSDVRILYDDEALYIGATLDDADGASSRLARRDALVSDADYFIVSLDSYHDHGTAYSFSVNPSGQKRGAIIRNAGFSGYTSWDPIWSATTALTDVGWSVEMRIPFSQLRFSRADVQEWGIQLERIIRRRQENLVFAFTPKLEQGGVPRYGHLEGIPGIDSGRRLELLPYLAGQAEFIREEPGADANLGNPYRTGSDYFGNAGVDLVYGLTSNLTLNGTVNPDFGQVEVDPAVINLTDFETRFQERRPFFVEGADIFSFGRGGPGGHVGGTPDLLYSRRIRGSPHGDLPSAAVFSDAPVATTILGAAKLTGRTRNGWSVGVLEAVTERETGVRTESSGARGVSVVEPATNFSVGRLRKDTRGGRTSFGGIASAVNRRLGEADPLARPSHSHPPPAGQPCLEKAGLVSAIVCLLPQMVSKAQHCLGTLRCRRAGASTPSEYGATPPSRT